MNVIYKSNLWFSLCNIVKFDPFAHTTNEIAAENSAAKNDVVF